MEQIYTIPVNEAFEIKDGCPFCRLSAKLEKDEIDLILGASMMEPDIRKKTNAQGFCSKHFDKMMKAGKRLPLALILESHLDEIDKAVKKPLIVSGTTVTQNTKKLSGILSDCYVCNRVDFYLEKMLNNAAALYKKDPEFKVKLANTEYFCLPHYAAYVNAAKAELDSKTFGGFYKAVYSIEEKKMADTEDKISYFVKKFDYRYQSEPWNGAENAPDEAISLLCGDKPEV